MPTTRPSALRKYAAIGLLACAASWVPLASAQTPPTPVVVMDSTSFDFYSSYSVSQTNWRGPAFTTGAVPTRITELTFGLSKTNEDAEATLRLFQLDDTTELPIGSALATASLPSVITNDGANLNPNTYTAAQLGGIATTTLLAGKKYALILSSPDGSLIGVSDNDGPGNAYTYAGGFSVAASGNLQTEDGGTTWTQNRDVTPALKMTVVPFEDVIVVPPAAPTPAPGLGAIGLVSLVSVMGFIGLRRSRKSA